MSTPTDGPGGQPNPYGESSGQPADPYGQPVGQPANPYGAQPAGGGGYGSAYPGGPPGEQAQSKGLAIAALVLALIACVIPNLISLVLAIIVLVKRKGGKGLAIAAIVIDIIVLIVWVALFAAGGLWLVNNVVTVDNAKVGQCVSTDTGDSDEVGLLKQECGEPHDAEVIVTGDLTADEVTLYGTDPGQICIDRYTGEGKDVNALPGDTVNILTMDLSPAEGETFVCIVENGDGTKLAAK